MAFRNIYIWARDTINFFHFDLMKICYEIAKNGANLYFSQTKILIFIYFGYNFSSLFL